MAFHGLLRWTAALALTAALVSSAAPVVRADDNAEARVFFEEGNRLLTRGLAARGARRTQLLGQALDSYVRSLGLVRSRNTVYNAGVTLEALGRNAEAFTYITEYLGNTDLTEEERREAQGKLDALRQLVAVVAVASSPSGAAVRVDRRDLAAVGVTPLEVAVTEGQHTIHLSLEGYHDAALQASGQIGERVALTARLEPEPIALIVRAPSTGTLTVDGEVVRPGEPIQVTPGPHVIRFAPSVERTIEIRPGQETVTIDLEVPEDTAGPPGMIALRTNVDGASVFVDGQLVDLDAEGRASVGSGRRTVRVEAPGHSPATSQVDVVAGGSVSLEVSLERDVGGRLKFGAWPVAMWVATGALGVTAIVAGVRAIDLHSQFDETPSDPLADEVETWNILADVFAGTALAVGAIALVLTILNRDMEQPPSTIQVGAAPIEGGGFVTATVALGGGR